jgi:transposase-like protein
MGPLSGLVDANEFEGLVQNKSLYLALGVTRSGTKEVLGMWVEKTEGAKCWHRIMTELATKLLYLALRNIAKRWIAPPEWKAALPHFAVLLGDRFHPGV